MLFAAMTALCAIQDVPAPDPALIGLPSGVTITQAEYRAHLHDLIGGARLEELLFDRLMAREVAALDQDVVPAAIRRTLVDPRGTADRRIEARIARDFGDDREAFLRSLEVTGRTLAEARRAEALLALRDARTSALVRVRRRPEADDLRRLFDHRYGVDGQRVRVRHVMVSFNQVRERLGPAGQNATQETLGKLARKRIDELHRQVEAGEPLDQLGATELNGYNYQVYGVPFAEAVRALEIGAVSAPVETMEGFHLIEVLDRVVTAFDDVRDEVREAFLDAPPSLAEQRRLRDELFEHHEVPRPLRPAR